MQVALEHQAEARRKQDVAVLGAFAAIDKNLAGIEVDIADLDVDELAHAHRRIEEQLEQDLVLHVTAVLDGAEEAFQIGIGKQLRQPALFASPAQAQLSCGLVARYKGVLGTSERNADLGITFLMSSSS